MKVLIALSLCIMSVLAMPMDRPCPAGMETVCEAVKACVTTMMSNQAAPAVSNARTRPSEEQKAAMKACLAQRGISEEQLKQLKETFHANGSRQGANTQG
uniref:Uncharacterized protein n=1 Tax=Plectus sambesii TaxID=2011161 RepID=A0A914WPG6_9BILA